MTKQLSSFVVKNDAGQIEIRLPTKAMAKRIDMEIATQDNISTLKENLNAPCTNQHDPSFNVKEHGTQHLANNKKDYVPPAPELVRYYFNQLKTYDTCYTDSRLAELLELSSARRVRAFKEGSEKVPFAIWQRFLILTGRIPQPILKVIAYFD